MVAIIFSRFIGPVPVDVIISEKHRSEIEITGNPIETGAEVHDHAYLMPKKVTLDVGSANATATFNALMRFQETRYPFVLVSGLSVYRNMMIKSIEADRTKDNRDILRARLELQEVILVATAYAASPDGVDGSRVGNAWNAKVPRPETAGNTTTADRVTGIVQRGDQPTVNAPTTGNSQAAFQNKSILSGIFGG